MGFIVNKQSAPAKFRVKEKTIIQDCSKHTVDRFR